MNAGSEFRRLFKQFPQWVTRTTHVKATAADKTPSQTLTERNPEALQFAKKPEAKALLAELSALCLRVQPFVEAANRHPNRDRELLNAWAQVQGSASKGKLEFSALEHYAAAIPILAAKCSACNLPDPPAPAAKQVPVAHTPPFKVE